jgi:hypothetical protein
MLTGTSDGTKQAANLEAVGIDDMVDSFAFIVGKAKILACCFSDWVRCTGNSVDNIATGIVVAGTTVTIEGGAERKLSAVESWSCRHWHHGGGGDDERGRGWGGGDDD